MAGAVVLAITQSFFCSSVSPVRVTSSSFLFSLCKRSCSNCLHNFLLFFHI